ncbi:MAG: ATP-binding protein [Lachnospiraceae bacterium]|nr:ATP-binding protein [Lachnospiraceae bacterium]
MKIETSKGGVGMLLQFRFKNYKSFAEDTILDMTATTIRDNDKSLITVNDNKILPVASIYGANASGKSNVFGAFRAMQSDVLNSYDKDKNHLLIRPFVFCKQQKEEPTEFEVSIYIKEEDKEYRYGFTRDQNKVYEEWLFEKKFTKSTRVKEKCIYYRKNSQQEVETDLKSKKEKEEINFLNSMVSETELLLTALGKRRKIRYFAIYDWFYYNTWCMDYSNDKDEIKWTDIFTEVFYENLSSLEDVVKVLQKFDTSILDLKIEKEKGKDLDEIFKIYSFHACDGGEPEKVPFESESSGTKKIFLLLVLIRLSINLGRVLFIDELDAKLHPLALRYIVRMITDREKNVGNGQLIFASHNLVCLDSSDLRRDEIWFVEKNSQKSSLYSLYDFKEDARADLSFGKNYLSGRFGAIPFQD